MANKYTALPIPSKEILEKLYFDEVKSQKEIGEFFNTTQKVVFSWFKKLGIKSRIPYKRNQLKENNSSWKGDNATYAAFHYRVEKERGKPHYCSVCGTMDKNRYEWANLTGNYNDINDYARMCIPCHRKYDLIRRKKINKNTINVNRKKQICPR